jgi:hypothetical protein
MLQICPVYDDCTSRSEEGNSHRLIQKLLVNDKLQCSLSLFTGQTRHKNHNNYMIYKSLQLGKPVMQKLILNNSIGEEEKSVIHKLNQVIAMFLNNGRNQIWIILIKSYHLQKTKIAKVVINQMQIDKHKHETKD